MVQGRPYGLHVPRTLEARPVANIEPDAVKRKAPPERGSRLSTVATLRQRPDNLPVLLLCESLEGHRPNVAGGTEGQHEFRHGFIIRRLNGCDPVVLAHRHVKVPELEPTILGQPLCRAQAFRGASALTEQSWYQVGTTQHLVRQDWP